MKKITLLVVAAVFIATSAFSQIVLDDFNNGTASGAVVGGSSWDGGQVTQNATTITVGGIAKDDNGWGTTSVSFDGSMYDQVQVTAQVDAGNYVSNFFVISFEDVNLNIAVFSVSSSSFQSTLSTVNIPVSWTGGFDATNITGWNIGGGSTGTNAFRMTFDNLVLNTAAVPEPSTYAAIVGTAALGIVVWRRRQVNT